MSIEVHGQAVRGMPEDLADLDEIVAVERQEKRGRHVPCVVKAEARDARALEASLELVGDTARAVAPAGSPGGGGEDEVIVDPDADLGPMGVPGHSERRLLGGLCGLPGHQEVPHSVWQADCPLACRGL